MVDSSRLPPSTPAKPPGPATVLGDQSARAVRLPDALMAVSRGTRVEAEVVRQNTDGTVRIRTPQGDMDIQVRGKQPQPGQRLEVDIPAGNPPRQVVIRSAPQPSQQQPQPQVPIQTRPTTPPPTQQTPAPSQPPTSNAPPVQTRPVTQQPTTPAPTQPSQGQTTPPANNGVPTRPGLPPQANLPPDTSGGVRPAPQPAPLPVNTPVRFMPATPAQAQQMVQAVSQMMTSLPTTATRTAFAANLIAQNAQDSNAQTLQAALQTRPAETGALAKQFANTPLPMPHQGASFPSTSTAELLHRILNMPLGQIQTAATTQTTPGAITTTPATILPATGSASPLATLIAAVPGGDAATPGAAMMNGAARIAQMDARVLSILPPNATLSPSTGTATGLPAPGAIQITQPGLVPQAPAGTVIAQVTGFTPQSLPLITVQWPGGGLPQSFVLQYNAANLPVGSTLVLQPQNLQIAPPGTQPAAPPVNAQMAQLLSLFGPGPWPVMDEAYQTLLQVSPQAAQALARSLPSPGNPSQLGAAALLFIAAVRSGDIGSWLGDKKIDALKAGGKNNLLSRLTQDLSTLAQRASDSPALSSEWRPVPLPMFYDGQIQKIALYVKQDGERGGADDKDKGGQTRFIFDLDLDRMGGVQLDGLVRDQRFDLVVRTQLPLSEGMRQAMKTSYSHALQDTELHGDLSFQGDIKNWVNVLQKEAAFGASA